MTTLKLGKYQVDFEEGKFVNITNEGHPVYNGPWYKSLPAWFEKVSGLKDEKRKEYELELSFIQ